MSIQRSISDSNQQSAPGVGVASLIERLEKATGSDGNLDKEIYWAISDWINEGGWWRRHKVTGARERYTYYPAPQFTSSLDAAIALVPGYHKYIIGSEWCAVWQEDGRYNDSERVPTRNRPAIALCIAALKARTLSESSS